jgi:hypothetical protein
VGNFCSSVGGALDSNREAATELRLIPNALTTYTPVVSSEDSTSHLFYTVSTDVKVVNSLHY